MSNPVIKNTSEDSGNLFTTSDEPPSTKLKNFMEISKRFNATIEQWNDWKWQISNCITKPNDLCKIFKDYKPTDHDWDIPFQTRITPHYLSLASDFPNSPLGRMTLPSKCELIEDPHCCDDSLNEEHQMPVPNLVHRYPDRALVLTTTTCAVFCRYCTRKRCVGHKDSVLSSENLNEITDYLISHPGIKDCIISGGDFLTLDNKKIKQILDAIDSVESIEIIRIGTKVPVVLPQRFNDRELIGILQNVKKPLYINTHFSHPLEINPYSATACKTLANLGIPLGNQNVILRNINDTSDTLAELYRNLLKIKVKPYYVYICDLVAGSSHFRTPFNECVDLIDSLSGKISGMGIPKIVLDSPQGLGKINVSKSHIISSTDEKVVLFNSKNQEVVYWN